MSGDIEAPFVIRTYHAIESARMEHPRGNPQRRGKRTYRFSFGKAFALLIIANQISTHTRPAGEFFLAHTAFQRPQSFQLFSETRPFRSSIAHTHRL